ncbi:hypothetical protein N658DRAFT_557420 [Parathielavia hyrcaniae]|uniref:Ribosome biogenesis protein Urb1 n=1 Tax=Parathielavia hyrcaniae TaxID=113614 RepID=A0AAN6T3C0_9PEZI|nr:hypothetical protein N658DRAFT_557420 [Parathielavia hyrcaniae]
MAHRFARGPDGRASQKRQKVVHEAPTSEEVHASRQLQQLLSFSQDPIRARHGLQSFKLFLDQLLGPDGNNGDRPRILKDYLQSTTPAADDESPVYLPDVMQTWSYGAQTNNENIMSAVPVVLALLLKLLSQSLESVPFGLGICRTLLQKRQQELVARNLSADKGKSFIISPTLRMLTEAASFDGGAIAKPLFRARASMLKSLARNMGIVHRGDEAEDTKRPSARSNAILFLLSALKYLHPEAKNELLSQRDIVAALTRDVKQDPPYLVKELLEGLRAHVLLDDKLPRDAKASLLNASTLTRLSALYQYRLDTPAEGETSIADIAHEFLMAACTSPGCGLLRQDAGFYPRELDPNAPIPTAVLDEWGLEVIVWMNKFKTEIPVRNYALSNFLPNLRPWSSLKQSELVISIFKAAPELVAHYFLNNKSFTFEPKLSATWTGYAAFLFHTVTLPIPDHFCRGPDFPALPPPTSIVVDNILPPPLNQKALSRSLANKSNMISFFATRILVVALEKLDAALTMHRDPSHAHKTAWAEAARRLVDEFRQRSPGVTEMINAYRSVPEGDILHREAASRLLRLCYEVLPQHALLAKFDVSPFLETSLTRLSRQDLEDPKDFALSLKELENLLSIAGYSPGMRWFAAPEGVSLSPFTRLLKVCIDAPRGVSLGTIREVVNFVAVEEGLVPRVDGHPGLLALLEASQVLRQSYPDSITHVWPFLDNCLSRYANSPVKYVEKFYDLIDEATEPAVQGLTSADVSLATIAMLEQLPFAAAKEGSQHVLRALGRFLPSFLGYSAAAGESKALLDLILSKMVPHLPDSKRKVKAGVLKGLQFQHNPWPSAKATETGKAKGTGASRKEELPTPAMDPETLEDMLHVPDGLEADNSALVRWSSKSVDELVDEGYLKSLVALLVSEHASIRKEALVNIRKAAAKIKESEYEERDQVWLLLMELAETAGDKINDGPLASPIAAFACHAIDVQRDPLSCLYPKVNTFLVRGPSWSPDRIPLVDDILEGDPIVPNTYYTQTSWLLGYLIDGLRTKHDLELFHKRRAMGPILEHVLVSATNPYLRWPLKLQVLRLLYRATCIEGGSTTLTTRFGIMSWLEATQAGCTDASEAAVYEALRKRVWETSDQDRVRAWSRGGLDGLSW